MRHMDRVRRVDFEDLRQTVADVSGGAAGEAWLVNDGRLDGGIDQCKQ